MTRGYQFSLGRLMGAIGIFALGLWLLRTALDTERIEVAAIAVLAMPIIVGAAVGKLFGNAMTGVAVVGIAYWLLVFAALAIGAIGGIVAKWIW
ncbi:MAG TPA: hypothetical protein VHC22_14605 [Pirellulales bacterium]|nr:hypothetical protein [Pirellulales bacterium]